MRNSELLQFIGFTSVMIPVWSHLFPFRTEKLNMPGPKIFKLVFEKIGRRRGKANKLNLYPKNHCEINLNLL